MLSAFRRLVVLSLALCALSLNAQDRNVQDGQNSKIEQIKAQPDTYLFGEAQGKTINGADRDALADLIGQISTSVESDFTLIKDESDDDYAETFKAVVRTYSKATLNNTERIVSGKEPKVSVFRYIRKSEVRKIFEARRTKIVEFVKTAIRAEQKLQIADALRNYYWAQTLLRSHPDGSSISFVDESTGESHLLATWIPEQINDIFANIRVFKDDVKIDGDFQEVELRFLYNGAPVANFDFTYWDGRDWSNIVSAKDGRGIAELPRLSDADKLDIKGEYAFVGEATIDAELKDVMESLEQVPYKSSYLALSRASEQKNKGEMQKANVDFAERTESFFSYLKEDAEYRTAMSKVEECIASHNSQMSRVCFDDEGWAMFEKLIGYGRAKIYGTPSYRFAQTPDGVICRSMPLVFSFPNSDRTFVEDVVFEFDSASRKIHSLSFGLAQESLDCIVGKSQWNESSRLTIIRFLENYKTAYALKRIDYINSIFADDALIIVGNVLKRQTIADGINIQPDQQIVRYTTQTKAEYMRNLRAVFAGNEFINLRFADNEIRKAGNGGEIYGIQIRQDYFSSNYGDTGYLFLMVDLNDKDNPTIHVRAWQPEKDPDFGLIDLSSFTF